MQEVATFGPRHCKVRFLLLHQQTALINAIRANLAEFGIVVPARRDGVKQRAAFIRSGC
jgi:transposase